MHAGDRGRRARGRRGSSIELKTDGQDKAGTVRWPRPLAGLRGIGRADLPGEIAAGFTLAALVIPLNIGYAQVAGLPATMGLYAAIVPLVLFALFTSSRSAKHASIANAHRAQDESFQ